jgi:hypothetical protein
MAAVVTAAGGTGVAATPVLGMARAMGGPGTAAIGAGVAGMTDGAATAASMGTGLASATPGTTVGITPGDSDTQPIHGPMEVTITPNRTTIRILLVPFALISAAFNLDRAL